MIVVCVGIVVTLVVIALTYWAVVTRKSGGDDLDRIQKLADAAAALADTAVIYRQIGMDKEAEEAFAESERLNLMVIDAINGIYN